MPNVVKKYFRVLEVISSLVCKLEYKSGIGGKIMSGFRKGYNEING